MGSIHPHRLRPNPKAAMMNNPTLTTRGRASKNHVVRWLLGLAMSLIAVSTLSAAEKSAPADWKPIKGLFANIDDSVFFWGSPIPAGKAGETIDRYVDVMAEAGTTVLLCNTNARRTNYRSNVWDAYWDGYDPKGPDDQPFLAPLPREEVAGYRNGIGNCLAVFQEGVDYPTRMVERCRHDGISPWITLRMNDCHNNNIPDHPFHGTFWRKNPQFYRQNCPGYFATCLDYAHPEVRDFYMALVGESLERFDMDGLELDFMRECYLFSAGKEAEGAPILTDWIRQVHKRVDEAAARRGHPIRLGVRVPSRPEVALAMGLEAIKWAKEGLIDVLVVTPRWATTEFDMPLDEWRPLLGDAPVTLAGGLEILYRPWPGAAAAPVSPEMATGGATAVLSRGADSVYLFNYFQNSHPGWSPAIYRDTLKAMTSLDTLLKKPRTIGINYRDITAPGESYSPPLPAQGKELAFSMRPGPVPAGDSRCQLLIDFAPVKDTPFAMPTVTVNGKPCEVQNDAAAQDGRHVVTVNVPLAEVRAADVQQIKLTAKDSGSATKYRVERVELSLTPLSP
jgi:hypothetical protein